MKDALDLEADIRAAAQSVALEQTGMGSTAGEPVDHRLGYQADAFSAAPKALRIAPLVLSND